MQFRHLKITKLTNAILICSPFLHTILSLKWGGSIYSNTQLVSTIRPTPLSHNVTHKVDNHNDRQHVVALRRTTVLGCVLQEFNGIYVDSKLRGIEASCITSG